jgi:hypothetical protein
MRRRLGTRAYDAARIMTRTARFIYLVPSLLLGACASAPPTEPTVLSLPGLGKSLDQFNADALECRRHAGAQAAAVAGAAWLDQQRRYDYAYIQCMYVKGHKVPVPGQFTSAPSGGPPPPEKSEPVTK